MASFTEFWNYVLIILRLLYVAMDDFYWIQFWINGFPTCCFQSDRSFIGVTTFDLISQ